MSSRIVLYTDSFWISPYVFSCFVALHEKNVEFEADPIALQRKEHHDQKYRDRSITGRVPALEHGDFWLAESSAIIEYIEELFPAPEHQPLLPRDARDRARARQVMAWIRSDLDALREERPTTTMFYERTDKPLSAAGRAAADKLLHVAALLLPGPKPQLFADWSIADADLAFMLHRLILNGHDVPAHLRDYAQAQWKRPSVAAFVRRERPPFEPY
jgi:glutathione S-transferase